MARLPRRGFTLPSSLRAGAKPKVSVGEDVAGACGGGAVSSGRGRIAFTLGFGGFEATG